MGRQDKGERLEKALKGIEKEHGKGVIMRLGDAGVPSGLATFSTGSVGLDAALGIGGLPCGRVVEIYGPESSGKTTLTLSALASVQAQGGVAAFVDAEHALDIGYARKVGVDVDNLLVSQPDHGEQALAVVESLVRSEAVDVIVIDSVAALVPKAELEGEMGDAHMGLQARLMSQALRKLTSLTHRAGCTLIFINQLRQKIGVVFGSPETTTGGNALKFYASIRLDIRRIGTIRVGSEALGNQTRVKVVKNKLAPPFRQAEFPIVYGHGIDREGEVLDLAVAHDLVDKSGAWYSLDGERLGQGREKAVQVLRESPEKQQSLEARVRAQIDPLLLSEPGEKAA